MGRRKFLVSQVAEALQKSHGLQNLAAEALGCSRRTIANYVKEHPTVAEAYDEAREVVLDLAESKLYKAINDDKEWAIKFYLSTVGKTRGYTQKQEIEHSGKVKCGVLAVPAEMTAEAWTDLATKAQAAQVENGDSTSPDG
jgi:predicted transcriptional regulator